MDFISKLFWNGEFLPWPHTMGAHSMDVGKDSWIMILFSGKTSVPTGLLLGMFERKFSQTNILLRCWMREQVGEYFISQIVQGLPDVWWFAEPLVLYGFTWWGGRQWLFWAEGWDCEGVGLNGWLDWASKKTWIIIQTFLPWFPQPNDVSLKIVWIRGCK